MFGDRENENMNFDSVPDISFNSNGQPVIPGSEGQSTSQNGQFIPPAAMMMNEAVTKSNDNIEHGNGGFNFISGDFNMFKCSKCNTTFGVSNGGSATDCIVCHSRDISNIEYNGNRIDGFIPFNVSERKAYETYRSKVLYNPVIPFCFKKREMLDSIRKVYIPGYLYNMITKGDTKFLGVDDSPNGRLKYDVKFNNKVEHNNIFHKSTTLIKERVFNAVGNYSFNNILPFNPNNIGQCYYLENNIVKDDVTAKVEDNCKKHVIALSRRKVNHKMKKVLDNNLVTDVLGVQNVLVPVYMLNVRYGNKDYMYIMNGETGESSLEVTFGSIEMLVFGIIVAAITFGISVLLSILL